MATYQVRHLYCIPCDTPVRVRNLLVGETEVLSPCSHCNGALVQPLGKLNLNPNPSPGRNVGLWPSPADVEFLRRFR